MKRVVGHATQPPPQFLPLLPPHLTQVEVRDMHQNQAGHDNAKCF